MSVITIFYLLLVIAGVVWVVYRFMVFMRDERDRESKWTTIASDDRLRSFLDSLKREKKDSAKGQTKSGSRKRPPDKTN
jgi:hypothetical protein